VKIRVALGERRCVAISGSGSQEARSFASRWKCEKKIGSLARRSRKDLERDPTLEPGVEREIDDPHPALRDLERTS